MDSLDHSPPPSSNFLCPKVRFLDQVDPEIYFSIYKKEKRKDSLLEGRHDLSPLDWSKAKIDNKRDIFCLTCFKYEINTATDFWCNKCGGAYHKECVESPPEIKVPYHPKHPLQLCFPPLLFGIFNYCNCCGELPGYFYYHCSICDFSMHPSCAIRSNILSINYPKRHEHTLTYFPRKSSLTCDVCALPDDHKSFIYICYHCDFIVHKPCIYLPTTIRISRHDHRISFTSSFVIPNKDESCGVCRKRVEINYGKYSCVKGCNYVVHSKCATRRDLWDGRELEGEPEIEYGNIKSFEEIGDGVIQHFSHPNHYMRLESKVDDEKRCQLCIFPIYDEGNIYSCMKCDFILHETCAHLPRIKWHQLHAHPLTLQVDHKDGKFSCDACERICCGFAYACNQIHCSFKIDVRCALVSEPFVHELHPDPLFLIEEEGRIHSCSICGILVQHLNCIKCVFYMCFKCATMPKKVKYRDDEHYLTFFYEKDAKGYHWCEICEIEIDPERGFYTCNLCSVTLHVDCMLVADPSMKSDQSFIYGDLTLLTILNNRLSRPICSKCQRHSPYRIAYITPSGLLLCSMKCISSLLSTRY